MNAFGLPEQPGGALAGHRGNRGPAAPWPALSAAADPALLVVALRRRVEAMRPRIKLPELVLNVKSWHPPFVDAFTPCLRQ